jgi:hypothetical protein
VLLAVEVTKHFHLGIPKNQFGRVFFPVGNRDGWVSFFRFEGIPISNVSHYLRCGVSESLQQRLRFPGKSHCLKQHQSSTMFSHFLAEMAEMTEMAEMAEMAKMAKISPFHPFSD